MNALLTRGFQLLRTRCGDALRRLGMQGRSWRWIGAAVVLLLALLPRLILLLQLDGNLPTFDQPEGGDSAFYDRVAAGEPAPRRAYFHSPLYRWFLAAVYGAFGRDLFAARAVQLLLGAVTAVAIYFLALRLFRRTSIAMLAGGAAGLFGPALLYEGQLLVDGLIALLAVLVLHVFLDALKRPSLAGFALLGAMLGIAALARAVILVWLPVLVVALAMLPAARPQRALRVAALLLGTMLVIAPVTLRNYLVEGDFVLITANGGLNFYVGHNESANGSYTLPRGLWFRPGDPLDDFAGWKAAEQALGYEPSSSTLSRWWATKAWSFISDHPAKALWLAKEKLRILVNDYEYPQLYNYYVYREVAPVLRVLPTAAFIVGPGLAGLAAMWAGRHGRRRRLVTVLVAAFALAFVPFFVTGRYRAAWIALLTPFAAWAVVATVRAARSRRWRRAAALLAAMVVGSGVSLLPLRAHPTRANQHIDFAQALLDSGDAEGAVYWGRRATEVEPRYGEAWAIYGRALLRAGRPAQVVSELAHQMDELPRAATAYRELGAAYLETDDPTRAAAALRRCISMAPGDPEAWLLLGKAMEELRCWQRALDAYRAVVAFGTEDEHAGLAEQRHRAVERRLDSAAPSATDREPTCPFEP